MISLNERVGDSFRPVKRLKRANRMILWLKKGENFTFCSWGGGGGGGGTQQSFVRRGIAKPERFLDFFTSTENLLSVSPFEPFYPRI